MTVSVADKIIEFLALLRFNLIHELADLVLQALVQYGLKWFRETVENAPIFRIPNVHPRGASNRHRTAPLSWSAIGKNCWDSPIRRLGCRAQS